MSPPSPDEIFEPERSGANRPLWRLARGNGISRRRFLMLLSAGGAAAVLAACAGDVTSVVEEAGEAEATPWFKEPASFIVRSSSLETRLENMRGVITPNRFFFVRNNSASIDVDVSAWRLLIEGDAVGSPLELSYADLLNMRGTTLVSYLECAGNHRAMFGLVNGRQAEGTQWERGAVGNAEWMGVRLRDVLELAGISEDAESVLLVGLDEESPEGGFRRAMPVAKAVDPDTLLAYGMNGETLSRDHGYPLAGRRAGVGRQLVDQVVGTHRGLVGAALDAQQHQLVRAHRGRLPARRRGGGSGGYDADREERAGATVAGRHSFHSATRSRLRALPSRDSARGVERGLRVDVERRGTGCSNLATFVGTFRVRVVGGTGGVHHHDSRDGWGREHAAERGALQPEGLLVQPTAAASGYCGVRLRRTWRLRMCDNVAD